MASLEIIARMRSDFPTKFGIPRQSGLVRGLRGSVVFEPPYREPEALRGLEAFSHIWLLWGFSEAERAGWSPTVRPPRLGGNERVGVFATRSPYRPNGIGLSAVEVERIEPHTPEGPIVHVLGADLMDGTPIFDIKPYLPFADSHPRASAGFAEGPAGPPLRVRVGDEALALLPEGSAEILRELLAQDPRPSYQDDPNRLYGMEYAGLEIKFTVEGDLLTVRRVERAIR